MNSKFSGKSTPQNSVAVEADENGVPVASKSPRSGGDGSQKRLRPRPKPVFFWTNADVIKWLKRHCADLHSSYSHMFVQHDITGRSLIYMNDVNLEKLGILNAGHRDDIWREILKLRLKSDILELRDFQIKGCSADDCTGSNDVAAASGAVKWRMPLVALGTKGYYLGIFFKANWFRSYQFCRYHGLHLVSIETQEENQRMEDYIKSEGLMGEHFWTSGTDQAEEGNFFWMGTGRPFTFTNWNAGEPNNFKYENNEEEHCLELWNRDGKGLKWNDTPCSFETYFVCERIEEHP